jgi:hypothetical protein
LLLTRNRSHKYSNPQPWHQIAFPFHFRSKRNNQLVTCNLNWLFWFILQSSDSFPLSHENNITHEKDMSCRYFAIWLQDITLVKILPESSASFQTEPGYCWGPPSWKPDPCPPPRR